MAGRASRRGVLLALWLVASPAGAEPVHDRDRLEQVRERIEAVQARMRETAGEQDSLTRKLAETEQEIGRIARRLRALEDQHPELAPTPTSAAGDDELETIG